MESFLMPLSSWMDKKNVVYLHNGTLLSHKKEWILSFSAIWIQSDNTECNKPDTKRQMLHVFTHSREPVSQPCKSVQWNSDHLKMGRDEAEGLEKIKGSLYGLRRVLQRKGQGSRVEGWMDTIDAWCIHVWKYHSESHQIFMVNMI